jgi:hypothetical protein
MRLTELMNIESNLSPEEKNQLANNLCLIVRHIDASVFSIAPSSFHLVLGRVGSGFAMCFLFGEGRVQEKCKGKIVGTRRGALGGLRDAVEETVARLAGLS